MYKLKIRDKEAFFNQYPSVNDIQKTIINWFGKDIEGYSHVDSGNVYIPNVPIKFYFLDTDDNVLKSLTYVIETGPSKESRRYTDFEMNRMLKGMSVSHVKQNTDTIEVDTLLINKSIETFREINIIRNDYEKLSKEISSITIKAYENVVSFLSNKVIEYREHINDYININTGISIDRFNNLMRGMFSTLPTLNELNILYYLANCETKMVGKIKELNLENEVDVPNKFPTSIPYGLDKFSYEEAAKSSKEKLIESSSFSSKKTDREYKEISNIDIDPINKFIKEVSRYKKEILEKLGNNTSLRVSNITDSNTLEILVFKNLGSPADIDILKYIIDYLNHLENIIVLDSNLNINLEFSVINTAEYTKDTLKRRLDGTTEL
ncbi:hypothetical protein D3C81_1156640 [compost metagenome]